MNKVKKKKKKFELSPNKIKEEREKRYLEVERGKCIVGEG